jgi:hypothetical protein
MIGRYSAEVLGYTRKKVPKVTIYPDTNLKRKTITATPSRRHASPLRPTLPTMEKLTEGGEGRLGLIKVKFGLSRFKEPGFSVFRQPSLQHRFRYSVTHESSL